jgi:hypothetical protein
MVKFEALEQTLRLRLVSGPVDEKFFYLIRNSLSHTVSIRVKWTRTAKPTQRNNKISKKSWASMKNHEF